MSNMLIRSSTAVNGKLRVKKPTRNIVLENIMFIVDDLVFPLQIL